MCNCKMGVLHTTNDISELMTLRLMQKSKHWNVCVNKHDVNQWKVVGKHNIELS